MKVALLVVIISFFSLGFFCNFPPKFFRQKFSDFFCHNFCHNFFCNFPRIFPPNFFDRNFQIFPQIFCHNFFCNFPPEILRFFHQIFPPNFSTIFHQNFHTKKLTKTNTHTNPDPHQKSSPEQYLQAHNQPDHIPPSSQPPALME
jgi:hypothetical protein